ncbi:MAG: TIGR02147 family protein [Myxococcota bacterium]
MPEWAPNIFEYLDYREYLRDYYEAGKKNLSAFSYRYLARLAGFSSPNFFKLVMDGDRNLSSVSVDKFATALKLDREEKRFFEDLVAFNQAESVEEKNEAFEQIAASQRFRRARRIDSSMFEYLSRWYHPVIRELAARDDFRDDPEWVASHLNPSVSVEKVSESLGLLFDMGLLQREEDGSITRGNPSLTTGHEVRSLAIGNYHRQMLERAEESIESIDRSLRDISALTVCIDPENVDDLKERIHAFRETLLDLCDRDENPSAVFQMNFQLFPLSTVEDEEK